MIIILNFTRYPITPTQRDQVVAGILRDADPRFLVIAPKVRVLDVPRKGTPAQTVAAIPLSRAEWGIYAIIPFIPPDQLDARALLDAVNVRRGYESGVVVRKGLGDWGAV